MQTEEYYRRDDCRICRSRVLDKVVELTPTPPGNAFVNKKQLNAAESVYPLELFSCSNCHHIQLGHVVNPTILYQRDYTYVTSTSPVFVKHFREFSDSIIQTYELNASSFVIDIGSNDGTCLRFFQDRGMKVLGVDPATNIAQSASASGIPTISDFFSLELAKKIAGEQGKANVVTSHNACAHIDDLDDVIAGVSYLLEDDGIFVMEVGYFLDVYENKWFDTIYHEHLDYHTVTPLPNLFERFDMEIIKVERIEPQGGSIRVVVQKKNGRRTIDASIRNLVEMERSTNIHNPERLKNFQSDIDNVGNELRRIIREIGASKKRIAAFGAPTKATTLTYHFGIEKNDVEYIVDDNPLKQNLFTPGKHIPVYDSNYLYRDMPEYVLILAWNFADAIMANHVEYAKRGGRFVVPMPTPKIV